MKTYERGGPKAAVTLLEYGDFECSFCGAAYPILRQIQRHFGGGLKFAFKNFPLTKVHVHALQAAEAAEAAGDQGKFWEMHDLLFENQSALEYDELLDYAKQLGLNLERFALELRNHASMKRIEQQVREGVHSEVEGTPTLFINGELYQGPVEFERLRAAIERAMDETLIRIAI